MHLSSNGEIDRTAGEKTEIREGKGNSGVA